MAAKTLMIQGTASSVGKSLMVTALCRIFARQGLRVAPFKSQNMSLNGAVTKEGLEIGRATAVQAEAAGIDATVEMNPILLKPEGEARSQVVLMGKPSGSRTAKDYHRDQPELRRLIVRCLESLRSKYDLIIIEGAGSPAEVNLQATDIVNMFVARMADAPVLLVGDIDRGGVFASLLGTLMLLPQDDRSRVKGLIVNKFRGDLSIFKPGVEFLETRSKRPVLGVVPHIKRLRIADEDSVSLDERRNRAPKADVDLDVVAIRYPRSSNIDDLQPLDHEPGVRVRWITHPDELGLPDLVILPGSKNTAQDLAWLRTVGLAEPIRLRAKMGLPTIGICGGFQMMGRVIQDPLLVESSAPITEGLGIFPITTEFCDTKTTSQVQAVPLSTHLLSGSGKGEVKGYEIHMGDVVGHSGWEPAFELRRFGAQKRLQDGAVSHGGTVLGTLIHGLFEDDRLRGALLKALRLRSEGKGSVVPLQRIPTKEESYDRLADEVERSLDMDLLRSIIGLDPIGT